MFVGSFNVESVLREKPAIMAAAGYRRTAEESLMFTQREFYLELHNKPMSYKHVIPTEQYHYSIYELWEQFESGLKRR
jgi:hypothetical protein